MTEHHYYNALTKALQSQYKNLHKARQTWGTWQAAWNNLGNKMCSDPNQAWQEMEGHDAHLILQEDADFPNLLREISHAPFGIYTKGNVDPLHAPTIAIIGTRRASRSGLELAYGFAKTLARKGITIISGLAFGIDSAAHEGALDAHGKTIAVLGNGLDEVYPRSNTSLVKKIMEQKGGLVSEYPIYTPSLPHRFLERNRIVSGLSLGILVIEAPARSGSLATARFALDQNRDVFVVPGPITNPNYEGSHALIRAGATLVTSGEDVLESIPSLKEIPTPYIENENERLDEMQKNILNVIQAHTGIDADEVAHETASPIRDIHERLTDLVMMGIIKESGGKYFVA